MAGRALAIPHVASARQPSAFPISAFRQGLRYLDRRQHGPQFLHQEALVKLVIAALLSGAHLGHYRLGPFVVMANHLHVRWFRPAGC